MVVRPLGRRIRVARWLGAGAEMPQMEPVEGVGEPQPRSGIGLSWMGELLRRSQEPSSGVVGAAPAGLLLRRRGITPGQHPDNATE